MVQIVCCCGQIAVPLLKIVVVMSLGEKIICTYKYNLIPPHHHRFYRDD